MAGHRKSSSSTKSHATRNKLAALPGYYVNERNTYPDHEPTGTHEVPIFYPTLSEMNDFTAYINYIESTGAAIYSGIVKIVPPDNFNPRPSKSNHEDVLKCEIRKPVFETISGSNGVYKKQNTRLTEGSWLVEKFLEKGPSTPAGITDLQGKELERRLIFDIERVKNPYYGADTPGSLFDEDVKTFNLRFLGTIMDESFEKIPGVHSPYLYVGTYHSCFAWHPEDMDLYSINYLHFGAPKYWFAIPPEAADRFEKLLNQLYPDWAIKCSAYYRHKECIVTPDILMAHGIPYSTMIQYPREMIVTFPRGYHMGFNCGVNVAEATNFGTDRWIDFGNRAILCLCHNVEILMDNFMKNYREWEYKNWVHFLQQWGTRERREQQKGVSQFSWRNSTPSLWSGSSPNFEAERKENCQRALWYPHCAVCQMFVPKKETFQASEIPPTSDRVVKNYLFTKQDPNCNKSEFDDPTVDDLVTCSNCQVTVHASCYGGTTQERNWKCFRCEERDDITIESSCCLLCEERAGLLIPAVYGMDDGGFVHVQCAIVSRKTWFSSELPPVSAEIHLALQHQPRKNLFSHLSKRYLSFDSKSLEQYPWKCEVCKLYSMNLVECAKCVKEREPVPTKVHTTCGIRLGYSFELVPYPQCVRMTCNKCIF